MKSFLQFDQLDEVLSKDADAGKWIDDFVNSDDPKFAGKSKEKRKQMALAAYYAKQRNEEVDLDEEGLKDACWKGYEAIGTKKKNGKEVPNCVPVKEAMYKVEYKDGRYSKRHMDVNKAINTRADKEVEKVTPVKESMDKMFKHVHKDVSDPKLAHKQAMDVVKNNQGKVRKISDTHSEVDFPGGKSAVFKTSKEGDKVVTHIAHHNTYSESVELDESSVTTGEYFKKHFDKAMAAKDAGDSEKFKQHYQAAKTGRYGMSSAALTKHKDSLDKFKSLKEETLDELSDKTLTSYAGKAAMGNLSKRFGMRVKQQKWDKSTFAKHFTDRPEFSDIEKEKMDKRSHFVDKAVDKLNTRQANNQKSKIKEETLDELSKDTLGSYVKKSFAQGNELHQDLSYMHGDKATDAERKAVRDKISKRNQGIIKAAAKMKTEEAPIAPVPGMRDKSHAVMVHKGSKQRVTIKRENKKEYEKDGWIEVSPGYKLKEENEMISYSEFMAKLDESSASERAAEILAAKRAERLDKYDFSKEKQKPASAAKQVKGRSYGADHSDDEDDEDEKKKSSEPEVKRGRGRPAGSKSGARV